MAIRIFVVTLLVCGLLIVKHTQARSDKSVYDSNLVVYKVLAEVALEFDRTGDHERAAKVAHCIETMWNGFYDDRQRPAAVHNRFVAPESSKEIDEAIDAFIDPLIAYTSKMPQRAEVVRTYNALIKSLDSVDSIWNKN